MKGHQTTILDIARELKISKSTVSRALTGHSNINPYTKKLVLEMADKLDYQKNLLAIGLCTNRSNTIGIMVPDFASYYSMQVLVAAQEEAARQGYNVIISQSNETYETEVANAKVMLANQVDGLIVCLTKETRNFDHLKVFQRKGIPIVFFNRVCEEMIVPKVVVDDYDGSFKAVEHLIQIGKRRIAHLSGPPTLSITKRRLTGYLDALKKYYIPPDPDLIIHYDLDPGKVPALIKRLLEIKPQIDGIVTTEDSAAIEAIKLIKKTPLKIPEDIAIVGFNNDITSELIEPSLTTIAQPFSEIGRFAVEMVIDQMKRPVNDWKPATKMLSTNLIIRQSTARECNYSTLRTLTAS